MAKRRHYSIEVKDAKSKTILVSAAVEWTSDERQIAVAQIFRLPALPIVRASASAEASDSPRSEVQ